MPINYYTRIDIGRRYGLGPLAPHLSGFSEYLSQCGYAQDSGQRYVREVGRFSAWLYRREITLTSLNEKTIQRYMDDRWRGLRCRPRGSPFFLFFRYMRDQGLINIPVAPVSHSPTEYWLMQFRAYLSKDCGLACESIRLKIRIARKFIEFRFKQGAPDFRRLCVSDTLRFAKECAHGCSRGYIRLQMSALRKFLVFLYLKDAASEGLADGIPSVPVWRQASLPSYLQHQEVERMLQTSRRQEESVLRNYAILLLLVRLGLRAIEVQRLRLDDIHWADGWLAIQGKGGIEQRLPLSQEIGDAISHYVPMNVRQAPPEAYSYEPTLHIKGLAVLRPLLTLLGKHWRMLSFHHHKRAHT